SRLSRAMTGWKPVLRKDERVGRSRRVRGLHSRRAHCFASGDFSPGRTSVILMAGRLPFADFVIGASGTFAGAATTPDAGFAAGAAGTEAGFGAAGAGRAAGAAPAAGAGLGPAGAGPPPGAGLPGRAAPA